MNTDRCDSCYTIGHSDLPVEAFIYFLKKAKVEIIIDVRSSPYSKYQTQFNREDISQKLNQENIEYHYMGDTLGGRYSSPEFLMTDGTVDYEKVSTTQKFSSGLEEVIKFIHAGRTVSLMCSEKDPLRCHRFVLISKNLQKSGIEVIHLCPELIQKTQTELENELLNQNGLKGQKTLLGNDSDKIDLSYKRLNKKIGFKQQPKKETHDERKINLKGLNSNNKDASCPKEENKKIFSEYKKE